MKKAMLIVALIGLVTLGFAVAVKADDPAPVPIYASWDVNQDGVCNMIDLMLVKLHMATTDGYTYTYVNGETGEVVTVVVPPSENWNPAMDVTQDGVVNMLDYQIVKKHVGQLSPIIGYK
jgi:hypothetical protein